MNELQKKLMTLSEEELANLYKNTFNTPDDKLVLEDLKNRSYFYVPTYHHPKSSDVGEGMRNVLMHIETQISYEPEEKKEDDDSD